MYCGVYAPWDHAPKFLRQSEVRDPFIILKGFFDGNDVDGHTAKLKSWRHYVVNEEYYNDERFGPGNLIYDYEQNVKFLEAVFLLLLDDQEPSFDKIKITPDHLAIEKNTWSWYPVDFIEKELLNPYLVFKVAFDEIPPQAFRDYLWEWFEAALCSSPLDETTSAAEIITVYEQLKKMYAAAWLIFQRKSNMPLPKKEAKDSEALAPAHKENETEPMQDASIKNASRNTATAEKHGAREIAER